MCGGSSTEEEVSSSQVSNSIDKSIKHEEKKMHRQVKLLLLGWFPPSGLGLRETATDVVIRSGREWEVDHS